MSMDEKRLPGPFDWMRCWIPIAFLALFLTACAGLSAEKQLLVACQGYASTLTTLAGFKAAGKLGAQEIASVDALRPSLNIICLDGNWTNASAALDIVEDAMFQLIILENANE